MRLRFVPAMATLAALVASGCGSSPTMAKVKGRVTFQGKPVPAAAVTFSPKPKNADDREPGKPATGFTDAEGNYVLSTFTNYDGAQIGSHDVSVMLDDTNPIKAKRSTKTTAEVKPGTNDIPFELTP